MDRDSDAATTRYASADPRDIEAARFVARDDFHKIVLEALARGAAQAVSRPAQASNPRSL